MVFKTPSRLRQSQAGLSGLQLSIFDTLAFAGGGNRCWWQAGLLKGLVEKGLHIPRTFIGASGGAAVGAFCLTDGPDAALQACLRLFNNNKKVFDWGGLMKGQFSFVHQEIYPTWVRTFIKDENFEVLKKSGRSLLVAVSRPAPTLGLRASVTAGTVAFLIEENFMRNIHSRMSKALGLRSEFIDIRLCQSAREAQDLLITSASAPPLMSSRQLGGHWAFDGGFTDSAPLPPQTPEEKAATLVLLTRHYPDRPAIFSWEGRTYWQPSRDIPVSTWDITSEATVEAAYALGFEDANRAIDAGLIQNA